MSWHAVAAFLACARIGAIHSVVFAGFSAESLRDRIQDCKCRVLITSDEGRRGGKTIAIKAIVDAALQGCPLVDHVLVLQRTGNTVPWTAGRDKWWHEEISKVPNYCPPEVMSAEDPLFILYVSLCVISSLTLPNQCHITDFWFHGKAKGCSPYYCGLSFVCSDDSKICFRHPP